jgi:hypothetical protein
MAAKEAALQKRMDDATKLKLKLAEKAMKF